MTGAGATPPRSDPPAAGRATGMVTTVTVGLGARSYDILIGRGLLDRAGALIADLADSASTRPDPRRLCIVTDETVAALHLPTLQAGLAGWCDEPAVVTLPAGETSKSFAILERLCTTLLDAGLERRSVLVALGGGVIGDLTGFAAAVLLRGIDFVQVPTTLLAQVDSAVGGKTGINTAQGKNLVGAFHQPRLVLADTATLDTLPRRDLLAGYAEVVKYGVIDRPALFDWLERRGPAVIAGDDDARRHAIALSCQAKAATVAADEQEAGARALLNLGHTFGHALEAEAGYGTILHGEAVGIGMVLALTLSERLGLAPAGDAARLAAHLQAVGLPTRIPAGIARDPAGIDRLLARMATDKKVQDGRLTFILARGIGHSFVTREVPTAAVRDLLADPDL